MNQRHQTLALEHARDAGWDDPMIIETEKFRELRNSPSSAPAESYVRVRKAIEARIDRLERERKRDDFDPSRYARRIGELEWVLDKLAEHAT